MANVPGIAGLPPISRIEESEQHTLRSVAPHAPFACGLCAMALPGSACTARAACVLWPSREVPALRVRPVCYGPPGKCLPGGLTGLLTHGCSCLLEGMCGGLSPSLDACTAPRMPTITPLRFPHARRAAAAVHKSRSMQPPRC